MSIFKIIITFLKLGTIGFGGGSALIPIIEKEIVVKQGVLTSEEYLKHTVVSNITPGTLPSKLGATCGFQMRQAAGAVSGAYSLSFIGSFATVLIIALFSLMGREAVKYLNYASVGITVFIVFLLISYVYRTVRNGSVKTNVIICGLAFLATCGGKLREILTLLFGSSEELLWNPIFGISMINVMIISFFLIFLSCITGKKLFICGVVLSILYGLFCGSTLKHWSGSGFIRPIIILLFVVLILYLNAGKTGAKAKVGIKLHRSVLLSIAVFIGLPVVVVSVSFALGLLADFGRSMSFLSNVAISTVTSFGGGEAYVAVADSIFVQGGYVPADLFYGRVVAVANALPGPILVKIAAAIGFIFGEEHGGFSNGLVMALTSFFISVGVCSAIALVVLNLYDVLRDSVFLNSLKGYILPVICGTLISTSLSMLLESMKISYEYGFSAPLTFCTMVISVAVIWWLHIKFKLHDLILLAACIIASLRIMT